MRSYPRYRETLSKKYYKISNKNDFFFIAAQGMGRKKYQNFLSKQSGLIKFRFF